ncbi:MAG: tetratricopeptide repeat protein [Planctomycetota bacterium]
MNAWNPLSWLRWMAEFVHSWFLGIPWRDAPRAIPAIILTIVLFTTGFIAFSNGTGWRNRLLDRQLKVSLQRDDFPTAEIVIKRQLESDPDNLGLRFRFALVRDAQSFREEASVLMRQLLYKRHFPAAKWLLEQELIGKKWTDLDDEELERAGVILKLITDQQPKNLDAKKMYAEYLVFEKRLEQAIPLLVELSEVEPMMGLNAAMLARRLGDRDAAERYAERTLGRVEQTLRDDPTNANLAMNIAGNQIFLKRHSDAIKTLRKSMELSQTQNDRRMLSLAVGDAIVAYVNHIEESPSETVKERLRVLKMLEVAIRVAPNNQRVLRIVAEHVLGSVDEEDSDLSTVRQALIDGAPAGIAHFIKGTAALIREDADLAALHLEKAREQMPGSSAIMNNLAVAIALTPDGDLEKALKISNEAIAASPNPTPYFYETRGGLLYRLERYREAISDLERALAVPKLAKGAHEMLATCYDEVGDPELAEGHRKAIKELEGVDNTPSLNFGKDDETP